MRHLWRTTFAMVAGGAALVVASLVGGLGPIALISGVLLLWSGIVKLIVLRIWRQTLSAAAQSELTTPRDAGKDSPR